MLSYELLKILALILQVIVHVVLIVIEVVVLGAVLYFCRHMPDAEKEHTRHRWSSAWHVQKEKDRKVAQCRRKSVQGISGHEAPKVSNRRPSEEALNISGKDNFTSTFGLLASLLQYMHPDIV